MTPKAYLDVSTALVAHTIGLKPDVDIYGGEMSPSGVTIRLYLSGAGVAEMDNFSQAPEGSKLRPVYHSVLKSTFQKEILESYLKTCNWREKLAIVLSMLKPSNW